MSKNIHFKYHFNFHHLSIKKTTKSTIISPHTRINLATISTTQNTIITSQNIMPIISTKTPIHVHI